MESLFQEATAAPTKLFIFMFQALWVSCCCYELYYELSSQRKCVRGSASELGSHFPLGQHRSSHMLVVVLSASKSLFDVRYCSQQHYCSGLITSKVECELEHTALWATRLNTSLDYVKSCWRTQCARCNHGINKPIETKKKKRQI